MQEKYALLLLEKCLNIRPNQPLLISASVSEIEFVRVVARVAYNMGIKDIHFNIIDEETRDLAINNASVETFSDNPYINKKVYDEYALKDAAFLVLFSNSYERGFEISKERLMEASKVAKDTSLIFRKKQLTYQVPWCIAAVASEPWAKKVFPDKENSLELLWQTIFDCCLVNKENPILEWDKKIEFNNSVKNKLNALKFKRLLYKNALGTNLSVELPDNHIWLGTEKTMPDGRGIIVNMPTEEVFTSPLRTGVNGVLYSSRPLVYGSLFIDDFYLVFKDGVVTEYDAKVGLSDLEKVVTRYPNSNMLGEIALVNHDSPISNTGLTFYETLYDENASCHFAFGNGNAKTILNGENMSEAELIENGINRSDIHVDFMIGTSDLSIVGTTVEGEELAVFEDGNFSKSFK